MPKKSLMRIKKTPVLFSVLCSFTFFLQAAHQQQIATAALESSDTAILNDSLQHDLSADDPKKAFNGLFIPSTEKTGDYSVQLNPRAISFVQEYMNHHTKRLEKMKGWGKAYFDMMDGILVAQGLPGELKYLAVVESNLKSSAYSWAGAVGPWQFMPGTAKKMGLKVNEDRDERTDYYKSTKAAAKYLKQLFSIYGDWLLVIAAYNGGVGSVNAAIRKSHSHNFWDLQYYLPTESRNHVKKFIATHYIMEGNGGITTVTKAEAAVLSSVAGQSVLNEDELANSTMQLITGKYNSAIIAKNILMDIANFNRYNPDFDKQIAVQGSFDLRLPGEKMNIFNEKKFLILDESMKLLLAPLVDAGK